MHDSLGNRMKKNYENRYRYKLTRRIPVIMRLDGRAFHTLTRVLNKPFDEKFSCSMIDAADDVLWEIQGAKLAYIQSDEISILITDFDKLTTEAWFDYNIQKMCSIAAATTSIAFIENGYNGIFDCRVFNIPKEEVVNYFIWRQNDWIRNSIQMYTRHFFSHKECHKKCQADMHEMLHSIGKNWANDLEPKWKNGVVLINKPFEGERLEYHTFDFKKERNYIERTYLVNGE